jgi:hypothetical protein
MGRTILLGIAEMEAMLRVEGNLDKFVNKGR